MWLCPEQEVLGEYNTHAQPQLGTRFCSHFVRYTRHTHIFHQVDVLVSVSVAHHFVKTELILSEEQRQGAVLELNREMVTLRVITYPRQSI